MEGKTLSCHGLSTGCSSFGNAHRPRHNSPTGWGDGCSSTCSSSSSDPSVCRSTSHPPPLSTSGIFCPLPNMFSQRCHQLSRRAQPGPVVGPWQRQSEPAGTGRVSLTEGPAVKQAHYMGHPHPCSALASTVRCTCRGSVLWGTTGEAVGVLPNAQLAGARLPGGSHLLLAHRCPEEPGKALPSRPRFHCLQGPTPHPRPARVTWKQ